MKKHDSVTNSIIIIFSIILSSQISFVSCDQIEKSDDIEISIDYSLIDNEFSKRFREIYLIDKSKRILHARITNNLSSG